MIPEFPSFKTLTITDQKSVNTITDKYLPYSDFNFASLWSFSINDDTLLSMLNDNLVVKMKDYISKEYITTFLGTNKVLNTLDCLLDQNIKEPIRELKLIPLDNILNVMDDVTERYSVQEDADGFDYILSIDNIESLRGNKFYKHRRLVNIFLKMYPDCIIKEIDLNDKDIRDQMLNLFIEWAEYNNKMDHEVELIATRRLLELQNHIEFYSVGVFDNNKLIGYSIEEPLKKGYVMAHFGKGDKTYKGIYQLMENYSAKALKERHFKYLNYEQDMGIAELKVTKRLWYPEFFLKKYTIRVK